MPLFISSLIISIGLTDINLANSLTVMTGGTAMVLPLLAAASLGLVFCALTAILITSFGSLEWANRAAALHTEFHQPTRGKHKYGRADNLSPVNCLKTDLL
jgi:hypothetical protein